MNIINKVKKENRKVLTEHESKEVLKAAGITVTKEIIATSKKEARDAAEKIGYPVVIKGLSEKIMHKTESGIVELDILNKKMLDEAYDRIMSREGDLSAVLVQEMVYGKREFVVGLVHDQQFGPSVMFGLGGIFTEVFKDVNFRVAPLSKIDAEEMIDDLAFNRLLGSVRNFPPVDRKALVNVLLNVSKIGIENELIKEIDINPLIIKEDKPVAVDALIILK